MHLEWELTKGRQSEIIAMVATTVAIVKLVMNVEKYTK